MRALFTGVAPIVFGVAVVMAQPLDARACSCRERGAPRDELDTSAAVFEGLVLADADGHGSALYTRSLKFCVVRAWKGVAAGSIISVNTGSDGASCGYDSNLKGMTWLVYASGDASNLTTGICSRSQPIAAATDDLTALGSPTSVVDGGTPACVATGGGGCSVAVGPTDREGMVSWIAGLVIVGALGGLRARRSLRGGPPCGSTGRVRR